MNYIIAPAGENIYFVERLPQSSSGGDGNFCGYYTREWLENVRLVGELDDDMITPIMYTHSRFVEKLEIDSIYSTVNFTAETDAKAFEYFKHWLTTEEGLKWLK